MGSYRISTDESLRAVDLAGLQSAKIWALWASPDFNRLAGSQKENILYIYIYIKKYIYIIYIILYI